jgi:hypothetical protein
MWIDGTQITQMTGPTAAIPQTPHFLGMEFGLKVYGNPASSGIGMHVSEVKVFDTAGVPATAVLPQRYTTLSSQRYRI